MTRKAIAFTVLFLLLPLLVGIDLCHGGADISLADVLAALTGGEVPRTTAVIVRDIRLVKAIVAVLSGAALACAGLQMQTLFRNPLAGPYVLGVSSGASLGVAVFILGAPVFGASAGALGIAGAAWAGAAAVMVLVAAVGRRMRDIMVILILGMMIASGVGSVVQILQYLSDENALKAYVIWTMGSLGDVTPVQLAVLAATVAVGLVLAVAALKPLNMLLFGEEYALTMGLNVSRTRAVIYTSTVLLAGGVTAFCGPIGFIGLAMPHVARLIVADSDHRVLMPAAVLAGAVVMVGCDIVSKAFGIPVNAVTSLLGIPIVVWIVLKNR